MRINSLSLNNFRNHQSLDIDFTGASTTIIGRNGRGKTNIVEAVNYFATLGSHRVSTDQLLIKHGQEQAQITGVFQKHTRIANAKIQLNQNAPNKVFLNNNPLTRSRELLGLVNAVVFAPEDLNLVKGDPSDRRKFIDDFSVLFVPKYSAVRHEYERTLKQRNTLLKSNRRRTLSDEARATLEVWDEQLIKFGTQIVEQRLISLNKLRPFILKHGITMGGDQELLDVQYTSKWLSGDENISEQFKIMLEKRLKDEVDRGITLVGPHRDELEITLNKFPAKGYASHGQSWSIALAMRLATLNVLSEHDDDPILILDDVFAELDQHRRSQLLGAIDNVEQTLITAAVAQDLPESLVGQQILLEDK